MSGYGVGRTGKNARSARIYFHLGFQLIGYFMRERVLRRRKQSLVASALAMFLVAATAAPGGAAIQTRPHPAQWWFTTWGVEELLWPHSKGKGVTVAVVDSGVQADIPELASAVLPGADFEHENGNAHIDWDINGYGHGTGMAVQIAGRGGRNGFYGIAPEAKILPIVADKDSAYVKAIPFAVDRGAKVINISQGGPRECSPEVQQAIKYAIDHDVVVVAAAGNEGDAENFSISPANCKGVVAVGGSTKQNTPWPKSQRQPYVDFAAPAEGVGSVLKDGKFYTSEGGTSASAALTSGAIALIRSKFPQMTNREVVRQLIASALDIGPPGWDDQSGAGIIRPRLVLNGEIPKNTPNPVFEEYDKWLASQPDSKSQGQEREEEKSGSSAGGAGDSEGGINGPLVIALAALVGGGLLIAAFVYFRVRGRRAAVAASHPQPGPYGPQSGMGPVPGQTVGGPPPSMGAPMPQQQQWRSASPQSGGPYSGAHGQPPGPSAPGRPPGGTGPQQFPPPQG